MAEGRALAATTHGRVRAARVLSGLCRWTLPHPRFQNAAKGALRKSRESRITTSCVALERADGDIRFGLANRPSSIQTSRSHSTGRVYRTRVSRERRSNGVMGTTSVGATNAIPNHSMTRIGA